MLSNITTIKLSDFTNFKYFLMLGSFVLFIDFMLVEFSEISLFNLSISQINSSSIGAGLLIFLFYILFLSIIVPVIEIFTLTPLTKISWVSNIMFPANNRNSDAWIHQIKKFSIENNHTIAYNLYEKLDKEHESNLLLLRFIHAFIISLFLNFYASINNTDSIMANIFSLLGENLDTSSAYALLVFIILIYLMLLITSRDLHSSNERTGVIIEDNKIKSRW